MPRYPLPPQHLGAEHVAILEHIVAASALSLPGLSAGPVTVEVTLEPDNLTGGWRVRGPAGYLGWLDATEAAEFPDLERLRTSHLQASTWAAVELADAALDVAVHLGLGPWQVARNDLPAGALLLAGGHGVPIDTAASSDITAAQLRDMGFSSFFVTLQLVGGTVVAVLEDTVLGTVAAPGYVRELLDQGTTVCARAYAATGLVAVDLPTAEIAATAAFDAPVPTLTTPPAAPALPPRPATHGPSDLDGHYFPAAECALPAPHGPRAFVPLEPGAIPDVPPEPAVTEPASAPELFGDADAAVAAIVQAPRTEFAPWPQTAPTLRDDD